jgi:translation initiation factor IF-2
MGPEVTERKAIEIPPTIGVRALAERLGISPVDLLKALIANGIMASITEAIDYETAAIVGEDLGFSLYLEGTMAAAVEGEKAGAKSAAAEAAEAPGGPVAPWFLEGEEEAALAKRAPVVTVMGHVDHGKTTLLDAIRHTQVAAGESGGITQHIGAYTVDRDGQAITFIDTPGHEAFSAMRARGAQATDIAVIVVAADDGVMPQTREAIAHAQAAGVPIIVAITKVDVERARPERVTEQMAELGIVSDAWGGDTFFVPVSGVTGQGLDELLDAIVLVSEERPPLANPGRPALGTIIEGRVDPQRGAIASLLVQSGQLARGDFIVVGDQFGRVRAMFDEHGKQIQRAGPSTPVEIMGLSHVPEAGARFEVVATDKAAKVLVAERREGKPETAIHVERPMTLEDVYARLSAGETKALPLVVKADVQGTLEAVVSALERLGDDIKVQILHAATGEISEWDINLASASSAVVIGFRVGEDPMARRAVAARQVEVREYDVIYELLEDIQDALEGMLEPVYEDKIVGEAEVRAVFSISKVGKIAGCAVRSGVARRSATVRVVRGGEQVAESALSSLKRFTEDVREVREGFECGIGLASFDDFEVGDTLQFVVQERVR